MGLGMRKVSLGPALTIPLARDFFPGLNGAKNSSENNLPIILPVSPVVKGLAVREEKLWQGRDESRLCLKLNRIACAIGIIENSSFL